MRSIALLPPDRNVDSGLYHQKVAVPPWLYATFAPDFVKIGCVILRNPPNKQTD